MSNNISNELNVSINAPLLAYSLYERCNHLTDFEGLILGSYTVHKRSCVNDTTVQSEICQHELIVKKLPITGVRCSFYDSSFRLDSKKLSALLEQHSVVLNNKNAAAAATVAGGEQKQQQLQLLGWFSFNRVYCPEWLNVYMEISKQLNQFTSSDNGVPSLSPYFAWGGPLFLCTYERTYADESKSVEISECKYQMYYLNGGSKNTQIGSMTTNNRPQAILKPIKLVILNVGDTSHVEYSSIDNLNSDLNSNIVGDVQVVRHLTEQIQSNVNKLANDSLESINQVIKTIDLGDHSADCSRRASGLASNGAAKSKIQVSPSMGSWEMVATNDVDDDEDDHHNIARGQKREKADQSSSSGGNSDEMEGIHSIAVTSRRPASSHVTKRSRAGETMSSSTAIPGQQSMVASSKPAKSRGRNL